TYWHGFNPHGFIRNVDGTFISFDVPGAMPDSMGGVANINNAGQLVGSYYDRTRVQYDRYVVHGFIRDAGGRFTTFDAPGPTYPSGINDAGMVAGSYWDGINYHCFIR